MKLTDYMDQNLIFSGIKAADKPELLEKLADLVSGRLGGITREQLLRKLAQREADGSTGIGQGVAVPHATVEGVSATVCMLITFPEGIDFDSIDNRPVRVMFLLLSPPGETGLHVRLLARIARLVRTGQFVEKLAASSDPEYLYELVKDEDLRHDE